MTLAEDTTGIVVIAVPAGVALAIVTALGYYIRKSFKQADKNNAREDK